MKKTVNIEQLIKSRVGRLQRDRLNKCENRLKQKQLYSVIAFEFPETIFECQCNTITERRPAQLAPLSSEMKHTGRPGDTVTEELFTDELI